MLSDVPVDKVTVEVSQSAPAWEGYLASQQDAGLFHDPRWGELMQQAYGNRPYYLTARRGKAVTGVLQLVLQKSWLFGTHLTSLPYFDASGILADDDETTRALVEQAREIRGQTGSLWAELRQLAVLDEAIPERTDKVTMWLPLDGDAEAVLASFKSKLRNKVKKALKADLEVLPGDGELLGEFHATYARGMRDLGSPPHGRRFFELILETFPDAVKLFSIRKGTDTYGVAFTLADRQGFHVPWSVTDRRFRDRSTNRRLFWEMMAFAADAGHALFDFGRSTVDAGTYEFKKEWGCREVPLHWHFLMPEGKPVPQLKADGGAYGKAAWCWSKLPMPMVHLLGPRLIAKLP